MAVKRIHKRLKTITNDCGGPRMIYNGCGVPQDHLPRRWESICEISSSDFFREFLIGNGGEHASTAGKNDKK